MSGRSAFASATTDWTPAFSCRCQGQRPPALEGASLIIGVVCALRPEKGLPTLVEAFAKVVSSNPSDLCSGLRLVIVGSGPMLETPPGNER